MHPSIHSLIRPSSRPSFSLRFSAAGGILTINLLERLHQLLLGILSRLHGDGDDGSAHPRRQEKENPSPRPELECVDMVLSVRIGLRFRGGEGKGGGEDTRSNKT